MTGRPIKKALEAPFFTRETLINRHSACIATFACFAFQPFVSFVRYSLRINQSFPRFAALAAFPNALLGRRQRLHARIQLALMPSSLVAMNDALVDHGIDHWDGDLEVVGRFFLLASFNGVQYILDRGAQA